MMLNRVHLLMFLLSRISAIEISVLSTADSISADRKELISDDMTDQSGSRVQDAGSKTVRES